MALDTNLFVDKLIEKGFTHLCVVPCSFAKNLINSVINNPNIEYVPSASESVATSIAAGLKMSGAKPLVIVQSSGLTNMGSCITSLLNPYDVHISMMVSWRIYKEGDSEIQHKHLATQLPTLINAYGYNEQILDDENIDNAINQVIKADSSKTITILPKDTFSKVELEEEHQLDLSSYIKRSEYLKTLDEKYKNTDSLFIGTTGNTSREMYFFMENTKNFYMAGNMGGALSLGLGAAKASKKVFVCGGDAEFVMHMGGLTTAGRYTNIDLTYILFDNESNKSTGGQNTYQKHVDYINIAKASNLDVYEKSIENISDFISILDTFENKKAVKFVHIKCGVDEETPRPPLEIVKVNEF